MVAWAGFWGSGMMRWQVAWFLACVGLGTGLASWLYGSCVLGVHTCKLILDAGPWRL